MSDGWNSWGWEDPFTPGEVFVRCCWCFGIGFVAGGLVFFVIAAVVWEIML